MTQEEETLWAAFKALGDPTRLRILSAITAAPDGICVAEMVPVIGMAQPTISHHVAELVGVDLVTVEQVGIRKIIRINKGEIERVVDLLKLFLSAAPVGE